MPKKQSTNFVSRFFVWDPRTEKWSQGSLTRAEEKHVKFEHWKTVLGRTWAVCTHPKHPGVYFGAWETEGPHVPPYAV